MYTLRQYLTALADSHSLTRTLGEIDVCHDTQGRMCYTAGNSAVVFRIRHQERIRSLRCYTRPGRHLEAIYGQRLLRHELFLHTSPRSGEWVDVVLGDWIEGITLGEAIATAAQTGDRPRLRALSTTFDRLAAGLVADQWAHGDLKPDNIIVDTAEAMHLIDFDAQFLPAFVGYASQELGTVAFQHPARTAADFDASLDDFPAALISTALHALALDPTLYDRYRDADGLLLNPRKIGSDAAFSEIVALFEREGCAAQYRIAWLLFSPTLRLVGLAELLAYLTQELPPPLIDTVQAQPPELFAQNGLWGYRTPQGTTSPPLYDCGFDFSEGLAAVRIASTWHYIDPTGRTALSCPDCEAIKPFRDGRATIIRRGHRLHMDRSGRIFDI